MLLSFCPRLNVLQYSIPTADVIKAHKGKLFGERSQHRYIWGTFMNIFISSKDIFFLGEVNWGKTSAFLISIRN